MEELYSKKPLKMWNDVPVFSEMSDYIENYEKISFDHIDHFNKTGQNPFMEESYWKAIEESTKLLIDKYSSKGDKILDVGVGTGRLLETYKDLDKYGMDISTTYLNITKEKGINCCISLVEDMPYQDNYFDIITCTDVLEHVLDLNLAVKNILRVLKPGGKLIVRVPYREDISWYLGPECPYDYVHVRSFDENNLKGLFTKIFKTKILDWSTAGEYLNESRLKYPVPPYNRWVKGFISFYYDYKLKRDKEMYKTFFYESVINMVAEKPDTK